MYWIHGSRLKFLLADAFSRTAIMPAERQMFPFEIKSLHLLILQSISFIGLETLISYGGKPHLNNNLMQGCLYSLSFSETGTAQMVTFVARILWTGHIPNVDNRHLKL